MYKKKNNPDNPIKTLYHLFISSLPFCVSRIAKIKRIIPKIILISNDSNKYVVISTIGIKSFKLNFVLDKKYESRAK